MKIISPTIHGILDYVVVAFLFVTPTLFNGITGWFAVALYVLAVIYLIMTLATRFNSGIYDGISFRTHGVIEIVVALLLIISPWVAGFDTEPVPRNFAVALGLVIFVVWMLTDYRFFKTQSAQTSGTARESANPSDNSSDEKH